jgi:hypothetical protein
MGERGDAGGQALSWGIFAGCPALEQTDLALVRHAAVRSAKLLANWIGCSRNMQSPNLLGALHFYTKGNYYMTEKSEEAVVEAAAPNPALPDWYLQSLVDLVNGNEFEFPITLFVGGLMISGQLTSGHKYFEGLGEQLTQFFGGPSEDTKKTVDYLTSAKDVYLKKDDAQEKPITQYIHLREARVFVPGQQPIPAEGSWWRGRLSSVGGFHFGSLTVAKSS